MIKMSHIKTIFCGNLNESAKNSPMEAMGCGECQTSCQSACKTSCTVANQNCEKGASTLRHPQAKETLLEARKPITA